MRHRAVHSLTPLAPILGRGVGGEGSWFTFRETQAKTPSPPTPLPRKAGGEGRKKRLSLEDDTHLEQLIIPALYPHDASWKHQRLARSRRCQTQLHLRAGQGGVDVTAHPRQRHVLALTRKPLAAR